MVTTATCPRCGTENLPIVEWGVPAVVLISLGVLFLPSGVAGVCWLLPLVGLAPADSLGKKLGVVAGGMVSFMALRLLCSGLISPSQASENTIPLLFSMLLAAIVVLLYGPLHSMLTRVSRVDPAPVGWPATAVSGGLAVAVVLFQLVSFN
ncbi:MAG: hypothetical protein JXA09_00710 [Anaerolineae bacterium]|nr:hypothetical protein [Anaerolineae bacterium]